MVNADGSDLKLVASGEGTNRLTVPTFAPDGNSIAYACNPSNGTDFTAKGCGPLMDGSYGYGGLMLMNADGADKRMILLGNSLASAGESLSWSPDGQWVAMAGGALCSCPDGYTANSQIFAYRTDGSDLFNIDDPNRQITHETDIFGAALPQFTADGTQLLYFNEGNFSYIINRDGTNRHQIFLGWEWGEIVPASTGGGPRPTVDATRITVPGVRTLGFQTAKRRLRRAHLTVGKVRRRYSSRLSRNHVLAQFPRAGAHAHRSTKLGPPVRLVLSRGRRP